MYWLLGSVCLLLLNVETTLSKKSPNILYILLDDWGYSDGWTKANNDGDFDLYTLSNLWNNGVKLNSYYVNPTCAPTRSSFLTGQYSFRVGITDPVGPMGKVGLDLNANLLTDYLHSAGYYNVLAGKWHVGHSNDSYHPTERDFDEALYMSSAMHTNQYNHTFCMNALLLGVNATLFQSYVACTGTNLWCTYDLWNESITHVQENEYENIYDGEIWTQYILDFLDSYYDEASSSDSSSGSESGSGSGSGSGSESSSGGSGSGSESESKETGDDTKPWFLYWADNAPHSPVVTPPSTDIYGNAINYTSCDNLINSNRKKYCQMLTYSERSIYNVILKLKDLNIYDDTLIIISSDNGGEPGLYSNSGLSFPAFGQNYPLRGSKFSAFEGGIRVPGFITGGYLPSKLKGTVYNNLFHVVDWLPTILNIIDYNDIISNGNIDGLNQWDSISKLKKNNNNNNNNMITTYGVRNEFAILQFYSTIGAFTQSTLRRGEMKLVINGGFSQDYKDQYHILYNGTLVNQTFISAYKNVMLFNLTKDPYEYYDLSTQYPALVLNMTARLQEIRNGQTFAVEQLYTRGEILYAADNYRLNKQYGILGPWRNDPYYIGIDNSPPSYSVFATFLSGPICHPNQS